MATTAEREQAAKFPGLRLAVERMKAAVRRLPAKSDSIADAVQRFLGEGA